MRAIDHQELKLTAAMEATAHGIVPEAVGTWTQVHVPRKGAM
jgi:hypothetical protein